MKAVRVMVASSEEQRLRGCVRHLAAFSRVASSWMSRALPEIGRGLRELVAGATGAELTYVRVRDPATGDSYAFAEGASEQEFDGALRGPPAGAGSLPTLGGARLATAPLGPAGEFGRVAAGSARGDFPALADARLLQVGANLAGLALRHAVLQSRFQASERMLEARARQHQCIAQLGLTALTGPPLDLLLEEAAEAVTRTLGMELCEILEFEPEGESLRLRAGVGWRPGYVGHAHVDGGPGSQAAYTLRTGGPVTVEDLRTEERFSGSSILVDHEVVSGITTVIHDREHPIGVLGVHARSRRRFTEDDAAFVQAVANLAAAALQRHRSELERAELLARTRAAQAEAERAGDRMAKLLATMNHELRTPLNAIAGYADLLLLGVHGPLAASQRTDVERILHCEEYLKTLINDALDYLKLGNGGVRYHMSDVALDATRAAVEILLRPQMDAKRLGYERRPDKVNLRVRADRDKLTQILVNLLGNAVKFTKPGGKITLECEAGPSTAHIRVRDTGRGIERGSLDTIFEPFVQLDPDATDVKGTGLGLTISRELARGMGGDISVESTPGRGSVFSVSLPLSANVHRLSA